MRERRKIISYKNEINSMVFIYISTCSIYDPSRKNTAYVKHKLNMENVVKKNFNKFVIVRFPEVVGFNTNKNNLINLVSVGYIAFNMHLIYGIRITVLLTQFFQTKMQLLLNFFIFFLKSKTRPNWTKIFTEQTSHWHQLFQNCFCT